MRPKFVLLSGLLLFKLPVAAQVTPVVIPGSQVQKITSKLVLEQEYELQIMLPAGYGKTEKKYPVLYVMDAQWDFPLVTALYGQQFYDGFVPELIIVGITWTGKYSNPDSLRTRDYTPSRIKQAPQSGEADRFLTFLKNEAFPFIESHYKTDKTNRILMGCSLGGLFTIYALFAQPDLFQSYIAATPAISWDNEVIYKAEEKYFSNKTKPAARLYLCEGGVERGLPLYQKFVKHLISRGYKNLQVKSQVLEHIGHSGTKGEGYEHGLQFTFERPAVKLAPAQLKNILGPYKSANGSEVMITSEGANLKIDFGSNNQYTLYVASDTELYATAEFLKLHFRKNGSKNVEGFVLERYGSSQLFSKTKE